MVHARVFTLLQGPARLALRQRVARSALTANPRCSPPTAPGSTAVDRAPCSGIRPASLSVKVSVHPEAETADSWSLYDHPALYERIFSFRDIAKEVSAFYLSCSSRQHVKRQTNA